MEDKKLYTDIMLDAMTLAQLASTNAGSHTPVVSITDLELILKEHLKEQ
ncbi:MAG: hypothetical protein K6G04_00345 [Lachnospiraceae bacterium]|nr:hypothetical protein [Lachnospiraceae bacterium]